MKASEVKTVQPQQEFSSAGICIVCPKKYEAPYGRWGNGGTCSGKCERIQEVREKEKRKTEEEMRAQEKKTTDDDKIDDEAPARSGARHRLRIVSSG